MKITKALLRRVSLYLVLISTSGCGGPTNGGLFDSGVAVDSGGDNSGGYLIGGTVVGLQGELGLELNGADGITVTVDGAFQFSQQVTNYEVTLASVPGLQGCRVDAGVGTASADVADIVITCDDRVFFAANDGTNGLELWSSDGTEDGTLLVYDVAPSGSGSRPVFLGILEQRVALFASENTLYATDGTDAGTTSLGDIDLGPYELAGDLFYFKAQGALWMTDGTATGTVELSTIEPFGGADSMILHNGLLYFEGGTSSSTALWKSDGTTPGTVLLADLLPGNEDEIASFTPSSSALYFRAADGSGHSIWKTDGTALGTFHVVDANPISNSSEPEYLTALGAGLAFTEEDGSNGVELWFTDGSVGDVTRLTDSSVGDGVLSNLGELNGVVYFAGRGATPNTELWSSDGTLEGTALAVELVPGNSPGSPLGFQRFGDRLLFMGNEPGLAFYALWSSDGTDAGTTVLHGVSGLPDRTRHIGAVLGRHLYLAWFDGSGVALIQTDGTPAGSSLVRNICAGNCHADRN